MATSAPRWNRLAHDERREQILACAKRLFSERHLGAVSTTEIAGEAGVTRGLVNHYFGTKRELYLEVVRSMVEVPDDLYAVASAHGADREAVLAAGVERWLRMVERNRGTWLASVGAQGFGRDPDVEAILEDARERTSLRLLALLRPELAGDPPPELLAVIRGYGGLAEAASLEWLLRGRLTREQVAGLLLRSLVRLVDEVLPEIEPLRKKADP